MHAKVCQKTYVIYTIIYIYVYGCFQQNRGENPQIIHLFIGFSIIFTIHFRGNPIFGNNHIIYRLLLSVSDPVVSNETTPFIFGTDARMTCSDVVMKATFPGYNMIQLLVAG